MFSFVIMCYLCLVNFVDFLFVDIFVCMILWDVLSMLMCYLYDTCYSLTSAQLRYVKSSRFGRADMHGHGQTDDGRWTTDDDDDGDG